MPRTRIELVWGNPEGFYIPNLLSQATLKKGCLSLDYILPISYYDLGLPCIVSEPSPYTSLRGSAAGCLISVIFITIALAVSNHAVVDSGDCGVVASVLGALRGAHKVPPIKEPEVKFPHPDDLRTALDAARDLLQKIRSNTCLKIGIAFKRPMQFFIPHLVAFPFKNPLGITGFHIFSSPIPWHLSHTR